MIFSFVGLTAYAQTVDLNKIQNLERSIQKQLNQVENIEGISEVMELEKEEIKVNQGKLTPMVNVSDQEMVMKRMKRAEMERELTPTQNQEPREVKLGSGRKMNCERFMKKTQLRIERATDGLDKLLAKKELSTNDYNSKMDMIKGVKKDLDAYKTLVGI